ncbi:methyltransferase-like protein 24 isoform X2 [Pecten maximus]|uniref:methyltransferase-like protein 24 isoform X2 n=1 Tax=Pecten maximus TaxID=6579 RepID=UPI0014586413|nr:methyltransferase-like protein 24 isoform X2 [Pecten maximus]
MSSSRMKSVYIKLISIAAVVVTAFLLLSISRNSLTFSLRTPRTKSIDDLSPDFYRNIPDDIYSCVKTTKTYEYDFDNTDLYLLPSKENMCAMKTEDLEKLYQMYLGTIQTICKRPLRLGNRIDGGWDLCVEKQFLTPGACQVYSFGINYDFTFDDEIAKEFDCKVHSFDPSMDQESYQRSKNPFVYFHDIGIASKSQQVIGNKEWRMLTMKDTMTELGHKTIPDVIKMDIEYWEWDVLPNILSSSLLPKQFAIEYHLWDASYTTKKVVWLHRLWILKDLYDAGYRSFWVNRNLPCTFKSELTLKYIYACHEVSYVRIENDIRT